MKELYQKLFSRWQLITFMVSRRRKSGVFKTVLGHSWYVINPLASMFIYYFLIVVLFKRNWGTGVDPFVCLITTLTHYQFLSASLNRSCNAILSGQSLLMQIKLEPIILTGVSFWDNLVNFRIALLLMLGFYVIRGPGFSLELLAYPFLLGLMILIGWSGSILLSTLSVFYRDLPQFMSTILRILMYLTPVIYPLTFVPAEWVGVYLLNPLGVLFALLQWSVLGGPMPPLAAICWLMVFAAALWWFAHKAYLRMCHRFTKYF
jgi:lipopolysaccharide transport system permease protein